MRDAGICEAISRCRGVPGGDPEGDHCEVAFAATQAGGKQPLRGLGCVLAGSFEHKIILLSAQNYFFLEQFIYLKGGMSEWATCWFMAQMPTRAGLWKLPEVTPQLLSAPLVAPSLTYLQTPFMGNPQSLSPAKMGHGDVLWWGPLAPDPVAVMAQALESTAPHTFKICV